jgi:hypothetical protein
MKPETSTSQTGSEQSSVEYRSNVERTDQFSVPEKGIETHGERREQVAEQHAMVNDASAIFSPILPSPVMADDTTTTITTGAVSGPVVAADDDLIEKEWVDKAKKIVAETHNDPHEREAAVNQLQRDYLKKRYGRELGEV